MFWQVNISTQRHVLCAIKKGPQMGAFLGRHKQQCADYLQLAGKYLAAIVADTLALSEDVAARHTQVTCPLAWDSPANATPVPEILDSAAEATATMTPVDAVRYLYDVPRTYLDD